MQLLRRGDDLAAPLARPSTARASVLPGTQRQAERRSQPEALWQPPALPSSVTLCRVTRCWTSFLRPSSPSSSVLLLAARDMDFIGTIFARLASWFNTSGQHLAPEP
jgi:hypothetical protein